jgi:DNA-binding response OmpR family regulator
MLSKLELDQLPKKVLLVEDDRELSEELAEAFALQRMTVLAVPTAERAIVAIRDDADFELAITDIVLPGMSGLELLKRIGTNGSVRRLPVIVLTAHSSVDYAVSALRSEAADFLQKPVHYHELFTSVQRAYQASKMGRQASRSAQVEIPDMLKIASALYVSRDLLGPEKMPDIAWQLLIQAALASYNKQKMTVTSLCAFTGAPLPTALRHLSDLERRGYLVRNPDPNDRRCSLIDVSDDGRKYIEKLMSKWVSRTPLGVKPI